MQALDDITVLDLSHALAGPFASTMLGDFGGEIIKIEPLDGEISRAWGPPFYGDESAYFVNLNRNKKSVALDLKHPDGTAVFFRLLERADVVLENLRVGTVARLGIDYTAIRERFPRVVYCSISGFGQDGPYRDRAALDLVVQAESGMISVTGEPGGRGVRAGVSLVDDPRYVTNKDRNANRDSLIDALQQAFLTKTYEEWEAILMPAGIPIGAINTVDAVLAHPQVAARNAIVTCDHPTAGSIRMT